VIYCLGVLSIAASATSVLLAPRAAAFELFGIRFFEDQADRDAEAVIVDPQPYSAEIVTNATGDLDSAIRSASMLVADQDEPASGAAGLLAKARGDYRRITAALYGEGHYGGTVNILIGGVEAASLAPDVNLPDPVAVRVVVNPGPEFRFNRLAIVNQAPPTGDPGDQVDPPVTLGYVTGQVARSGVVIRAEQAALEAWRQQGYAKAEIASREVTADHATNTVDVTITVAPGRPARFGPIQVQGTEHMDPAFVVRQTGLVEGQEYDPDDLVLAQKRLDRLDVFRAARLSAAETISPNGLLPYTLIVQEQALRRFGVGANYSTVDGLGVEAYHLWRNLFGQAERLRLDARVAGIGFPVETEEFDYFFGGTFTKPGVFTPDTDLVATVSAERTECPRAAAAASSTGCGSASTSDPSGARQRKRAPTRSRTSPRPRENTNLSRPNPRTSWGSCAGWPKLSGRYPTGIAAPSEVAVSQPRSRFRTMFSPDTRNSSSRMCQGPTASRPSATKRRNRSSASGRRAR
jgi:translocation and assembly module TamA